MTVVWIFPYLPLPERLTIGPWTLIPRADLQEADATSADAAAKAQGVAALYQMPGNDDGFGAFVRSQNAPVGAEVDQTGLQRMYQALVTVLLDRNPSPAAPQESNFNPADRTCTAENGRLYGHVVDADGHTPFSYGVMVRVYEGGYHVGQDTAVIQPPHGLQLPMLGRRGGIDDLYANALYHVLSNPGDDSPDIPGAIRFLEVAWSNSLSVRMEARVLALRAGFDVLFGGAKTKKVRNRLSRLLDKPDAPRTRRTWVEHDHEQEGYLTDLQWWFQSFALLRNKLAHGGPVEPNEETFEGVHHVFHAELNLRRAIKQLVANAGHEEVLLGPYERIERLARPLLEQALEAEADDDPDVRRL